MGKVNPEAMKDWRDGDVVYAQDYKREREILRTAINDNFDRLIKRFVVKNASGQTKSTTNLDTALNYLQFQEGANVILDMDASTATLKISVSYGSGSVPTAALADGSVTTVKVANSAITEIKIANGAVTTNKLANGAVTTGKIADNAVNTAKIANNSVTEQKIANNSITSDKIVDQSVTASKLANNSVTTRAVADRSITEAKIQQGALDNRYYTKPETNALLNQKTDVFGDHKGTWQGLRVEDIDPEGFDAARITAIERQLNEDQIRSAELSRGLQVVEVDQTTPLRLKKLEGRTVVNLVPTFDSGAWNIPNNAYVDSPNKATLYIVDPSDSSTILLGSVSVKPSTTYTISMDTNARYYVRDIDNNVPLFSLESSHGQKYKTFTTASNTTRVAIHLSNHILGTGIYTFENVMLNEGSEPQEYVAGIKNLSGTYIKRYGKNLVPPLAYWQKNGEQHITIHDAYSATIYTQSGASADSVGFKTVVPVIPGERYSLSAKEMSEGGRIRVSKNTSSSFSGGTFINELNGGIEESITFTVPDDTDEIVLSVIREASASYAGVIINVKDVMLNYGSEPLPFEPQNDDYIIVDTELMSNPDGSNPETLEYRDGRYWKVRKYNHVILDGNLDWTFSASFTGYKRVSIPASVDLGILNSQTVIKYDGSVLKNHPNNNFTQGDQVIYNPNYNVAKLQLSISNEDSGWGDNYTPTPAEIKAYFNGWRMCKAGDRTQPYNGSGDKMWYKISVSNSSLTPILPTDTYPEWKPYQMQYTLETARYEDITNSIEGSITLQEGINVIEVGESMVTKEVATLVQTGSADRLDLNRADYPPTLKYRTEKILNIFANGADVTSLFTIVRVEDSSTYGKERAYILKEFVDQNATYTVTYIAEQWDKSPLVGNVLIEYTTNIKTALDKTIQRVSDVERKVSEIPYLYVSKFHGGWFHATLVNGWTGRALYSKDSDGLVHLDIALQGQSAIKDASTTLFILPEGYRPSSSIYITCVANHPTFTTKDVVLLNASPTGRVTTLSAVTTDYLSGYFVFRAER